VRCGEGTVMEAANEPGGALKSRRNRRSRALRTTGNCVCGGGGGQGVIDDDEGRGGDVPVATLHESGSKDGTGCEGERALTAQSAADHSSESATKAAVKTPQAEHAQSRTCSERATAHTIVFSACACSSSRYERSCSNASKTMLIQNAGTSRARRPPEVAGRGCRGRSWGSSWSIGWRRLEEGGGGRSWER
jgi:hypothetical protein